MTAETKPKRKSGPPYTPEEDAIALRMWRANMDYADIAKALGRSYGSIQTRICKLGKSDKGTTSLARVRVVELARQGWTIRRIAMQTGIDEAVAASIVEGAGLKAKVVSSYGNGGRYGVDMPLPEPGAFLVRKPSIEEPVVADRTNKPVAYRSDWTPAEFALFDEMVRAGGTVADIAAALGRTTSAIYNRGIKRGLRWSPPAEHSSIDALLPFAAGVVSARPAPVVRKPKVNQEGRRVCAWTPAEDAVLRDLCSQPLKRPEIATRMNRSQHSVSVRKRELGLRSTVLSSNFDTWSAEDIATVAEMTDAGASTSTIAATLGRQVTAVGWLKRREGICRPDNHRGPQPSGNGLVIEQTLRRRAGAFVSKSELIERIWGQREDGGPLSAVNIISVTVRRLRQSGLPVESVRGLGYRLVDAAPHPT